MSPLLSHPAEKPGRSGWAAFRPIVVGVLGFMALNLTAMLVVTFSPLNRELNLHYGNYLPDKLAQLNQRVPEKPDVLFLGTSQTHNGFIPAVFEREIVRRRHDDDHHHYRLNRCTPGHLNLYLAQNKISPSFTPPLKGRGDNWLSSRESLSETSIHSFNMGLPNNRYDIMLAYLRMHQRKYGKPRLLLVELSPSIQERDAATYYLPALYYRTLAEQDPGLAPVWLGNPLLNNNVRQELLLSSLSSFRQFRLTFSPLNLLRKVSEKLHLPTGFSEKLSGNQAAAAVETSPQEEAEPADMRSSPEPIHIPPTWLAKGWSPREKSSHMRTPGGVRRSVAEAEQYYIRSQKAVYFDKLEALLHYCHQQNIPVALVTWPNHPAYLRVFRQSRLNAAYQKGLSKLLAREKTPVIDLNQLSPESPDGKRLSDLSLSMTPVRWEALFSDPRHLTPEGAAFCSKRLAHQFSGEMARWLEK